MKGRVTLDATESGAPRGVVTNHGSFHGHLTCCEGATLVLSCYLRADGHTSSTLPQRVLTASSILNSVRVPGKLGVERCTSPSRTLAYAGNTEAFLT
jgi:hypothetical protein